ncbi:MAG: hypothetical protein II854_01460 [Prevotella sp.]|nr:hypothetical protein [Prevotella sp.]
MKKSLLIAFAAVLALTANAQKIDFSQGFMPVTNISKREAAKALAKKIQNKAPQTFRDYSAVKAAFAQKAPEQADILGKYIDEETAYTASGTLTYKTNIPVTIFEKEVEGTTYVCIHGLLAEGEDEGIMGVYDPSTGVIDCGNQIVFNHKTYGNVAVCGIDGDNTVEELSFTVDEDGTIAIDQDGWYAYLPDYEPADEDDSNIWNLGWECFMAPVNGYLRYDIYGQSGWVDDQKSDIFIEDFGTAVNVYNYFGGTVSMTIDDDLKVSMPTKQVIATTPSSAVKDTYGYFVYLVGMNGTSPDQTMEEISGTLTGNTILFPSYGCICSDEDEEGLAYRTYYYDATIVLNEGNFIADPTGIEEVKTTLEDRIKNTKTYNMLGQQVDRSKATGLLIRGGKKYIKKF